MKRFFILLIILLFSVWIGIEIVKNPGYIIITKNKLAIEIPLWLGLIGFFLSFIISYFLIRTIRYLLLLPNCLSAWKEKRHNKKIENTEDQELFNLLYQKPLDWHTLLKKLPKLQKKNWLSKKQIDLLKQDSYTGLLKNALLFNLEKFEKAWLLLPYQLRKEPFFINFYIQAFIRHHKNEKAEILARKILKKKWLAPLVRTYGLIKSTYPDRQLIYAEKWLKNHPQDPVLLLSLGRICRQLHLWGKAQDYFDASLEKNPLDPEVHQELGELLEESGKTFEAIHAFKKAIQVKRMADSIS